MYWVTDVSRQPICPEYGADMPSVPKYLQQSVNSRRQTSHKNEEKWFLFDIFCCASPLPLLLLLSSSFSSSLYSFPYYFFYSFLSSPFLMSLLNYFLLLLVILFFPFCSFSSFYLCRIHILLLILLSFPGCCLTPDLYAG